MNTNKLSCKQLKLIIISLLLASCGAFGTDILLPAFPVIQIFLQTTKHSLALSVPLYIFPMALTLLYYGPLSDQFGRRPIICFGFMLGIIGVFMCSLAHNITTFLIARIIMGLGMGASFGIVRAIMADTLKGKQLAIYASYISMAVGIILLLSPLLGSYLLFLGWHAIFIFMLAIYIIALLAYIIFGHETNINKLANAAKAAPLIKNYFIIIRSRIFIGYSIASAVAMSANICFITLSAFILQGDYKLTHVTYGWIMFAIAGAALIGKFINTMLLRKLSGKSIIILSYFMIGISGTMLAVATYYKMHSLDLFLICVILSAIGQSFIYSIAFAGAIGPFKHIRGSASALYGSWQYLVPAIAASLIAIFSQHAVIALALCFFILGIAGIASFIVCIAKSN